MRYFGIPTCPYCRKRVNLIRTWSLKRQGEYQCPRCNGISNIYLSPLVYVLALLAIFAGGSLYFFHKFVLDDINLETALYVFIPFAAFFFFSLFMVYLEKPVIKKISRAEYEKKRRFRKDPDVVPSSGQQDDQEYYDPEDYIPRGSYTPGANQQSGMGESGVVNQAAFRRARQQAAMENVQVSQRVVVQHDQRGVQNGQAQHPSVRTAPAQGQSQRLRTTQAAPRYQQAQNIQQMPRAQSAQNAQSAQQRPRPQAVSSSRIEPVPRRATGQQSIQRAGGSAQQRMSFSQHGAGAAAQRNAGQRRAEDMEHRPPMS